jgi:hypothetical protein
MAHHILRGEIGLKLMLGDMMLQQPLGIVQARGDAARQVDLAAVAGDDHARALAQAGQEHLHLHRRGVLRLVQHHEGIGQRAAAHEGQRRDLDPLFLDQLGELLARQEIVQRVVERLHVGIDLVLHVAGQVAQLFARLDRGARQDDPVDLAADEHRHAHGHGEIGLAGARGADAEGQLVVEQRRT